MIILLGIDGPALDDEGLCPFLDLESFFLDIALTQEMGAGIMMLAFSSVALAAPNDVRAGSQGEDVRQVQQWLIEKGYFDGEADGICGEDTVKAIKHFQVDNDLEADGICGRMTRAKLNPNAQDYTSGRPMMVEATAYSAYDPGNGMYICMGTDVSVVLRYSASLAFRSS